MAELEFHPLANLFPLLEGAEFDELTADIREHGLLEPVVLLDGKILDGRNRYRACEAAGVDCDFVAYGREDAYTEVRLPYDEHEGPENVLRAVTVLPETEEFAEEILVNAPYYGEMADPAAFVVSLNLKRRHLSESQRAMIAAKLANLGEGRPAETAQISAVSQPDAARLLNVSRGSVQNAAAVQRTGTPELQTAVEQGAVSVSAASELAREPVDRQREIIAKATPQEIKAAIRDIKQEAKREAFGGELPPSPKKAKEIARETGEWTLGSDLNWHSPATEEQLSQGEVWHSVRKALEALAECSLTPADIERLTPRYRVGDMAEWAPAARQWLAEFEALILARSEREIGEDAA